jgi:hypothetical protein
MRGKKSLSLKAIAQAYLANWLNNTFRLALKTWSDEYPKLIVAKEPLDNHRVCRP